MWYAIAFVGGVAGGAVGYHFLFNPVATKLLAAFDAVHAKLDKVLAALN